MKSRASLPPSAYRPQPSSFDIDDRTELIYRPRREILGALSRALAAAQPTCLVSVLPPKWQLDVAVFTTARAGQVLTTSVSPANIPVAVETMRQLGASFVVTDRQTAPLLEAALAKMTLLNPVRHLHIILTPSQEEYKAALPIKVTHERHRSPGIPEDRKQATSFPEKRASAIPFEGSMSEKLSAAFDAAYNNVHSAWYRSVYAKKGFDPRNGFPKDMDEWRTLPCISKDDLAASPLWERVFTPQEEVLFIRTSTGTTGKGLVLTPRNFFHDSGYFDGIERLLTFLFPHHIMDMSTMNAGVSLIGGDPSDLEGSARLAGLFAIDSIEGPSSLISASIPHLAAHLDLGSIRRVTPWGERFSQLQWEHWRTSFPNAEIRTVYGLAELHGSNGRACTHLAQTRNVVHPFEELFFWELIDPETGNDVEDGAEGELVITTLWEENSFPALRYRTGDIAKRTHASCPCGANVSYEILGRRLFDRATLPGGELRSEELERAMAPYIGQVRDDYELHIYDSAARDTVRPRFELRVYPLAGGLDLETLVKSVSENLKVGPSHTLRDGIERGLYGDIGYALLSADRMPEKKKTRLVRHHT